MKCFRRETRRVCCGGVAIGGGSPVSVQSMTNTDTRDVSATVAQIESLAGAGCDIVRLAVPDMAAADALADIRAELGARGICVPLVADIHFDHRLAIAAIERGADKIRINPGNIGSKEKVLAVVARAKDAGIPIRVGVNSGSLERDLAEKFCDNAAEALCESALRNIELVAAAGFEDIVVSVKSSDVRTGISALRLLSERTDFPLHVGVTEAGAGDRAFAKSAIGIGALLADGIGDTIRVSLTGDPVSEVGAAHDILASLGMLDGAIDVISCPTCGRCRVDLPRVAGEVREAVRAIERETIAAARMAAALAGASEKAARAVSPLAGAAGDRAAAGQGNALTVAVMGCAVNGPGEASHADIGVACGDGNAVLFENGAKLRTLTEGEIVPALMERIKAKLAKGAGK